MVPPPLELHHATIGVITALTEEFAAVKAALGCERQVAGAGKPQTVYALARIPSLTGGHNVVAVALLPDMGNNLAAIGASQLFGDCTNAERIIMTGIAGAVPHPTRAEQHVRLGDLVISGRDGVVKYDLIKETPTEVIPRHPPRPPGPDLLSAVQRLVAEQHARSRPWESTITQMVETLGSDWKRPSQGHDRLRDQPQEGVIRHPKDPNRRAGHPRVFVGPIAAADILLKNPAKRDRIRDLFGVKAVEMEGSGIADATWYANAGYLVVRGTCDYCNLDKNDRWHYYAALIAAAFTRAIIEQMPAMAVSNLGSTLFEGPTTCGSGEDSYHEESSRGPGIPPTVQPVKLASDLHSANHNDLSALILGLDKKVEKALAAQQAAGSLANDRTAHLQQGEAFLVLLQQAVDHYDYRSAFQQAADLQMWLFGKEAQLPNSYVVCAYALLAEIEVLKENLAAQAGKKFDGTRSRFLIERARSAARQ